MDYKERYDKALAKAKKLYEAGTITESLASVFPELKESEDEKIRKALVRFHKSTIDIDGIKGVDILAWLEKQGKSSDQIHYWTEEEIEPIISDYLRGAEHYGGMIGRLRCLKPKSLEKQVEQKPISDTKYEGKAGDSLSVNGEPFDYEKATITQKDFAPKSESKFKVGDFYTDGYNIYQVKKAIGSDRYFVKSDEGIDGVLLFGSEDYYHLWTIQDAKDGDVLSNGKMIVIFKHFEDPSYRQHIIAYIGLDTNGDIQITDDTWNLGIDKAKPATKEQRELLFKKMNEAGYEWNADKKELEKVEKKQEWSEEDKEMFDRIDESLYYYATKLRCEKDYSLADAVKEEQSWLFSLKNRIQPQPQQEWSEEDEEMAEDLIKGCVSSESPYQLTHTCKEIADWLKSLKSKLQR